MKGKDGRSMELIDKLKSPPKENKSVPFWSINDKLEPEVLKWQIDEMKRMNMGGFFYHARGGYKGDYLGKDWMECAGIAVEHAKKNGMDAWMYDEAGWPSGFAGGLVNGLGDEYHQRWLKPFVMKKNQIDGSKLLGTFVKTAEGGYKKIAFEELDETTEYNVVYNLSTASYVDVLNPDVTAKFIEVTYQKYYDLFAEEMGKSLPGIFTDEPQYARYCTPWSYVIPEEFKKACGYDILDHLMALFEAYDGAQKVRYDFYSLCHRLFVRNYMKQIYDWCETHNCKLTGHILSEDSIVIEMEGVAGAMAFYEYMHVPGIDWLGRTAASAIASKQLQSAANQLDKKQTLSEMFGCTGWDISFDQLKWIAETQYVNGINFMCQHLESYTLRGQRKRDFPPSLFYHQSWWELYPQFNEYFNRLSALLTEGKQGVDVLVLHPIQTGWMLHNSEKPDAVKEFSATFDEISEKLGENQVDFHYGDEILMEKYASVQNKEFVIGKCAYKVVVMPQMHTIEESTYRLLMEYAESGGKIVSFRTFPTLINAVKDDRLSLLKSKVTCFDDYEALAAYLKSVSDHCLYITADGKKAAGLRYMKRLLDNGQSAYYIFNRDTRTEYDTLMEFRGVKDVKLLDLTTLEVSAPPVIHAETGCEVKLGFRPMQSQVLLCDFDIEAAPVKETAKVKTIKPDYSKNWAIEEMGFNSLNVDYCRYRVNKGEWSEPVQTHLAFKQLLEYRKSVDIDVKMSFAMEIPPSQLNSLYLVCEDPWKWEISINGSKVGYAGAGYWKDSAFSKIDIKAYAKKGDNEILISGNFYQRQRLYDIIFGDNTVRTEINRITYDTELESVYIVGDFGVKSLSSYDYGERNAITTDGPFVITEAPKEVESGEITTQGFCFFAETIKLSQKFQAVRENSRILLDMCTPDGPAAEAYINGRLAGNLFWNYGPLDITDLVKDGENTLTVKLYSSNRNLLGPHHNIQGEIYWVGPYSFTNRKHWNNSENVWTESYTFVSFGLKQS